MNTATATATATARLFSFLWTPNTFLCVATRRHSRRLFTLSSFQRSISISISAPNSVFLPSSAPPFPIGKGSRKLHFNAQPQNLRDEPLPAAAPASHSSPSAGALLPWPEWSRFFDSLVSSGYFSDKQVPLAWDELVDGRGLPDDFIKAADACLAFAYNHQGLLGSLSTNHMEVLVHNLWPFIFRNGVGSSMRMKSFLAGGGTDHSDKPSTLVDLVRHLLTYISTILVPSGEYHINNTEVVESSVRNLFIEFAEISDKHPRPLLSEPFLSDQATPELFGKNIEKKRGDWICPKCSFMNFARNMKCLECEEPRPQRVLTGGEWECPRCDFFNYGRNTMCLRCDCKKPGLSDPLKGLGYNDISNSRYNDNKLSGEAEKTGWFTKLSKLVNTSDATSGAADENITEVMTLHKGKCDFGTGTENQATLGYDQLSRSNLVEKCNGKENLNAKITQRLDEILQRSAAASGSRRSGMGNEIGQNDGIGSQSHTTTDSPSTRGDSEKTYYDEEGITEMEQAEKSERSFKQAGELHDVKDLSSATSDEALPEIMPRRKGENQFVVSKRKDRSLTSPLYKRRMAMEQSGSSDYVPFVPFPAGYFAKDQQPDEGPPLSSEASTTGKSSMHINNGNLQSRKPNLNIDHGKSGSNDQNQAQRPEDQQSSTMAWNSRGVGNMAEQSTENANPNNVNQMQDSVKQTLWKGRSLEGSAVKEPDPLDMSEEAKAERFFRRVAQIKDIKELSEIPDEDFPSIMPMRKGVNRFVISKRKTPLERRLAQSQYRRNAPNVNSDPAKRENEQNGS